MAFTVTSAKSIPAVLGCELRLREVLMLMAAVTFSMVMSDSAFASCGNYLFRHGKPVGQHSMATPSESNVHVPQADSNRSFHALSIPFAAAPLELPAVPCHGPNCSRSRMPLAPVPAAPTNLVRNFDQATLLETLVQASQVGSEADFPESERGARYQPSSVFRPPAA